MFSVAMVSAHEEVTTIVGQEVVFGPLALNEIATKRYNYILKLIKISPRC